MSRAIASSRCRHASSCVASGTSWPSVLICCSNRTTCAWHRPQLCIHSHARMHACKQDTHAGHMHTHACSVRSCACHSCVAFSCFDAATHSMRVGLGPTLCLFFQMCVRACVLVCMRATATYMHHADTHMAAHGPCRWQHMGRIDDSSGAVSQLHNCGAVFDSMVCSGHSKAP